jgi:hypothetical protein
VPQQLLALVDVVVVISAMGIGTNGVRSAG